MVLQCYSVNEWTQGEMERWVVSRRIEQPNCVRSVRMQLLSAGFQEKSLEVLLEAWIAVTGHRVKGVFAVGGCTVTVDKSPRSVARSAKIPASRYPGLTEANDETTLPHTAHS